MATAIAQVKGRFGNASVLFKPPEKNARSAQAAMYSCLTVSAHSKNAFIRILFAII